MGEVLSFGIDRIDPNELSDIETLDALLSMLTHPSIIGASGRLPAAVVRLLGDKDDETLSDPDRAWRSRLGRLAVDVDAIDDDDLNQLLNSDNYMADMYTWLRESASSRTAAEELREVRQAVMALRGIRAATLRSETPIGWNKDERWNMIAKHLGFAASTSQ